MLQQLVIRNIAIVEELHLEVPAGFTTITGETGAGKSIMIDALGLALGNRASADQVRHGASRAEVIATFHIAQNRRARQWLQARELEADDDLCILRRTLSADGRSRGYINGSPSPLADLAQLGSLLVHIHSQHEHQALMRTETHRELLDDYGAHDNLLRQINQSFKAWQDRARELARWQQDNTDKQARLDLLTYQVQELDELALSEGEYPELEAEHRRLANAESLISQCQQSLHCLRDNDTANSIDCLQQAIQLLRQQRQQDQQLADFAEQLDSALIQIEETARDIEHYQQQLDIDPEKLQATDQRLGTTHRLARKHQVAPEELPFHHKQLQAELEALQNSDEHLAALEAEVSALEQHYRQLAEKLSQKRHQLAGKLEREITRQIRGLGMPGGRFEIHLAPLAQPSANGLEAVAFQFSANPGQPPKPLQKIASGGELSRISLAIQVICAKQVTVPTLIFDEVDVGISGAVADTVGKLLKTIGENNQVLCVTHQGQVAAQGHQQLHVRKTQHRKTTSTVIEELDTSERIEAIARLVGGAEVSETTLAHARDLLEA